VVCLCAWAPCANRTGLEASPAAWALIVHLNTFAVWCTIQQGASSPPKLFPRSAWAGGCLSSHLVTACLPRRWMLAFNVSHTQDPRVCHYDCQPDSIGERPHARGTQRGCCRDWPAPLSLCMLCETCNRLHAAGACRNVRCVTVCTTAMHAQYIYPSTLVLVKKALALATVMAPAWACASWAEDWRLHPNVKVADVGHVEAEHGLVSVAGQASCKRIMHE